MTVLFFWIFSVQGVKYKIKKRKNQKSETVILCQITSENNVQNLKKIKSPVWF